MTNFFAKAAMARAALRTQEFQIRIGTNDVQWLERSFDDVFNLRAHLKPLHSNADVDLENIEEVFTLLETSKLLGIDFGEIVEDHSRLLNSLKLVIAVTIANSVSFRINRSSPHGALSRAEVALAQFLGTAATTNLQAAERSPLAILTFNYDLIVEKALAAARLKPCYFLHQDSAGGNSRVPLLKLHGSLNWATQSNAKIPIEVIGIQHELIEAVQSDTTGHPEIDVKLGYGPIKKYIDDPRKWDWSPFLVPPSWQKGASYTQIEAVWRRAAYELKEAEFIYIVGYSLPETDSFFRHLYALGTLGREVIQRFVVVNPDKTRSRVFEGFLGTGVRRKFAFIPARWDEKIQETLGEFIRDPINKGASLTTLATC